MFGTTMLVATGIVRTHWGDFKVHVLQNTSQKELLLVWSLGYVDTADELPARIHSSCLTSEVLYACDCDCAEQLDKAVSQIAASRRGVIFYILQEGRGAGLISKVRDRMLVQASGNRLNTFDAYRQLGLQPDHRVYDCVRDACRLLRISAPLRLLTNNPQKAAALTKVGIEISSVEPLSVTSSHDNYAYLSAKRDAGHKLLVAPIRASMLSRRAVGRVITPRALEEANRFVLVAQYILPISLARVTQRKHWDEEEGQSSGFGASVEFSSTVYHDVITCQNVVVLTKAVERGKCNAPVVYVHRDYLLERFPLVKTPLSGAFCKALRLVLNNGNGMIVIVSSEGYDVLSLIHKNGAEHRYLACGSQQTAISDFRFVLPVLKHHLREVREVRVLLPSAYIRLKTRLQRVFRFEGDIRSELRFESL